MSLSISKLGLALLAITAPALADETMNNTTNKMAMPKDGKDMAVTINARDIKWSDAPPELPKGAKMAVLYGDPTKSGPFTMRIKAPSGYKIAPHWHSNDEQLTLISGAFVLHMGDTMTAEPHRLTAGAFHFLPGKMHHAAETTAPTIIQVSGEGPFDIHYLNEADNPASKTARK